uniref:Uncharacterized protein n=1 Tax=viral metagenome TaxID=1070528 RepID=A0A6M3LJ63_9ZZZZ
MEYYITFHNQDKPERTPVMPDMEKNAQHNVELLKIQGATSIRVHKGDK